MEAGHPSVIAPVHPCSHLSLFSHRYNSADAEFDSTYGSNIIVYNTGDISWIPPGVFLCSCKVDITWFPFDEQNCEMKVGILCFALRRLFFYS